MLQRIAAILIVEVLRIRVAGANDLLVAAPYLVQMFRAAVADGDEVGHNPPAPVQYREVALVFLHHGDEHLLREGEIALLEGA